MWYCGYGHAYRFVGKALYVNIHFFSHYVADPEQRHHLHYQHLLFRNIKHFSTGISPVAPIIIDATTTFF